MVGSSLDARLRAAGVADDASPAEAWRALRRHEGQSATVIDLYELVARERGLTAAELPLAERYELAQSAMPDIWPGFELTAASERPNDPVEVVDYDSRWPERFAEWERAIRAALGSTAIRVEHVGSTSVPGLAAKPVIDIQVSVADLADEDAYVPALEQLGLRLRSRDELHRYFRPPASRPRDVHVHVCESGSAWEAEHLLFRDYLRRDREARDAYAREAPSSAGLGRRPDGLHRRQERGDPADPRPRPIQSPASSLGRPLIDQCRRPLRVGRRPQGRWPKGSGARVTR